MEIINKQNTGYKYTVNWSFFMKSRLYSLIFISCGLVFLGSQILLPLYLIETNSSNTSVIENSVLGASTGFRQSEFSELKSDANSQPSSRIARKYVPEFFNLKVPKLKISNAKIETDSFNMNPEKYLGHYAGSAYPGEVGNSFIYGHSVMPIMFNENNYKTIFSNLHKLEDGDEIFITFEGKTYTYEVFVKQVLNPDEVKPLETLTPSFLNEKTLSLMTCTPPGTTLKRLVVGARLVE
jgi:LPXTG-site transpeptidase (sortase) family protein